MSKCMTNAEAKLFYEGRVFPTTKFGDITIINYRERRSIDVIFNRTNVIRTCTLGQVLTGKLRDRTQASVYGVGIIGNGIAKVCGVETRDYQLWKNMLRRCYDENLRHKNPTYKDCEVSDNFKYLPYFEEWCSKQTGFDQECWQLDKDILIKGNKIYSENTCCFVPSEVNNLFTKSDSLRGEYPIGVNYHKRDRKYTAKMSRFKEDIHLGYFYTPDEAFNAYKEAKEDYVKEVAEKWKDQIDPRVYEALMKYRVEITD